MDETRLDALSRLVAEGPTRRAVVAGLGAVVIGRAASPTPVAGEAAAGWVEDAAFGGFCRLPGFPCGNSGQCCAGGCLADGTCGCRRRGRSARIAAICCSGKKKRHDKGVCR